MRTIINIIKKEFLQFKRDPKMFGIILIAPVIQLVFLGYAANLDVDQVKTVVYDQDRTTTSREFIERFTSSGYFKIEDYVSSYRKLEKDLNDGEVRLALVISQHFEEKITHRKQEKIKEPNTETCSNLKQDYLNQSQQISQCHWL